MLIETKNISMVVDASIIAKYMLPNEKDDKILEQIPKNSDWIAPSIIEYEIGSLLSKHVRIGTLTKEFADKEFDNWLAALDSELVFICPAQDYISEAFRLSCSLKHPFYDCCYLAVAQNEKCALITADKKLFERGRTIYDNIILVS